MSRMGNTRGSAGRSSGTGCDLLPGVEVRLTWKTRHFAERTAAERQDRFKRLDEVSDLLTGLLPRFETA